ncbi:MAG: hypothetical protein ABI432_11875 [Flavobacteriales bacterium]
MVGDFPANGRMTMDIQTLKVELVQRLMNTSDISLLEAVRRILGVGTRSNEQAGAGTGTPSDEDRDLWLAAGSHNLVRAYDANEPDVGSIELKEPNPKYVPWKPGT